MSRNIMNSNDYTSEITMVVRDGYVMFDWTDGRGNSDSVSLKLDAVLHDENVWPDITRNVERMMMHLWLKGFAAGVDSDRQARDDGYSHGAHIDWPNPYPETDSRCDSFEAGRTQRQMDNESGARIESLIAARVTACAERDAERARADGFNQNIANQMRTINTLTSERDEAIESYNAVRQNVAEVIEQRDAMAESLEQAQLATSTTHVPTASPWVSGVTIYRQDSNFNVTHWVPEGDDGEWTHEYLASQLRGAFADAHQAGRNERDEEVNRLSRTINDQRLIIEDYEHDWDVVRDALLEEAERRSWCSEYDEYVRGVNALTRRFDLIVRAHTYEVTVRVTQDLDYEPVDNAARDAGFPISHDVDNTTVEDVQYFFTLEDVAAGEIETKAEALRRAVYSASGVSEAVVSWEEAD